MSRGHSDYLPEDSESAGPAVEALPSEDETTASTSMPDTEEYVLALQQAGWKPSETISPPGITIPVEPGQLLMGNGPIPTCLNEHEEYMNAGSEEENDDENVINQTEDPDDEDS